MTWHWWQLVGAIGVGVILGGFIVRAIEDWFGRGR
jgi:hypothetical protein